MKLITWRDAANSVLWTESYPRTALLFVELRKAFNDLALQTVYANRGPDELGPIFEPLLSQADWSEVQETVSYFERQHKLGKPPAPPPTATAFLGKLTAIRYPDSVQPVEVEPPPPAPVNSARSAIAQLRSVVGPSRVRALDADDLLRRLRRGKEIHDSRPADASTRFWACGKLLAYVQGECNLQFGELQVLAASLHRQPSEFNKLRSELARRKDTEAA